MVVADGADQGGAQTIAGQAAVIDGDTIEIHGARIRLFGIDAPEGAQTCTAQGKAFACGRRAAFALADKIGRQVVECQPKDRDRYGRVVAVCRVGGEDVNGWMVAQGWALAYRHYSLDYLSQERRAQSARAGMLAGAVSAAVGLAPRNALICTSGPTKAAGSMANVAPSAWLCRQGHTPDIGAC